MANCIIHPIPLYQSKGDKSMMTYLVNVGQQGTRGSYVWYIEGAREKILVDAGSSVEAYLRIMGIQVKEIQTLDSGLSQLGLSFGDIDLVILTHLHHDHVAQASRFPNARFLIQRNELEFAQNPHPSVAWYYYKGFFDGLNYEVISGDTKICEEVSVISLPGHTPGGQSVTIKTTQGIIIISGLCTVRDNFEPPPPITLPVIPSGIHTNTIDAYDSLLRIKEMPEIGVPNHDPEYFQKSSNP